MADTGAADDTKGGTENNGDTVNITPPPSYDQVANAQDTPSEGSRGTTPPLPHSEDDTLPRGHADITPVESAVSIDTMEGRYSKKMDPDYGEKNGVNGYSNNMMGGEAEGEKGKNEEGKDGKKKDEKEPPPPQVGLLEVFRFATGLDWCFMILGTLSACIHGAALPCLMIVFGEMTDSFIADATFDPSMANITQDGATVTPVEMPDLLGQMSDFAIYYVIIGCAALVFAYGQVTFWLLASFRQTQKIRTTLIQAILRQEVGWFDTHDTGELNTRLSDDVNKIQEGIGDKLGNFFQWISCALAGIIIGFIYGWKMTLVIMATSPLIAGAGGFMTVMTTKASSEELDAYAKAGAVAEEVLGAIRTVTAFGGQKKEYDRYSVHLDDAKKVGIKKSYISGGGMGLTFFIIFAIYALAFWYGSKLVRDGEFTAGRMLIVFFSVLIGAFSVGNAFPNLTNLSTARGAAYSVWDTLNRVPVIDSFSDEGKTPNGIQGNVKFENVTFRYPSRLESPVLNGLSIDVQVGQTVALVGASGCGKSTAIQLLQRFYDPLEGTVYIDGVDVKEYNLQWLRQNIGVVSQEPVLFGVSIEDNIRYGREGVTHAEIEQACKEANAYNFIMELPQKFETLVGERGAQLSGGQKQRIAIARALVRNPKILLLDEATSALDTESEATVQSALDKASQGRTTIVIAHRLSTIKNADIIYGLKDGVAHESGTHDELMAKGATGIYYQLVTNQTAMADSDSLDEDFDVEPSGIKLDRALSHDHPRASFKRGKSTVSAKVETTDEEEDEKLPDPGIMRIMKMNRPEWFVILIGCIASLINGAVQPAFAVIFAEILGVFAKPSLEEQKKETLFFSMMFLVIGVAAGIAMFLQAVMFAISGEKLTLRMRQKMFDCYLKQEISFYDDHRNNTGAVCTRLATDASAIQGATGARLGTMIQNVAALGTGIIIGFVYSWHLTLLIFAFLPFILIGSAIQMKIMQGYAGRKQDALEKAGKVAIEAIENIRTVSSLVKEKYFCREYEELTRGPFKSSMRKAHVYGISFSFTTALIFFAYAACFYLGAYLIRNEGLTFENMFKVFSAIVFGAMAIGQASHFAPDYGKARSSAKRIFSLFDREPAIDVNKEDGDKTPVNGKIEFEAVRFAYPTRDTVTVLKGLDLDISPGQVVALVGSSGCGKSTTVSILERFYDPLEGHVRIDGRELNSYNLHHIRSQMSIVQQEPILFDMSIKDNIAYGDNDRAVPMDEIIQAARNANIHDFIAGLPEGYDTNVGDKGTQLSGGQKQRVAIARALVRNPKILLLDEATSALDTESEKVVQEALDRAQEGRTSIVIAHRLSTIQNADKIYVFHHGKINEEGTHSELLAHKGIYYKLHTAQQRKNKNS